MCNVTCTSVSFLLVGMNFQLLVGMQQASKNGGNLNSVNVLDVLVDMRRYRMGLIQTPDQLRFSYLALIEGAKQLFSSNDNEV